MMSELITIFFVEAFFVKETEVSCLVHIDIGLCNQHHF